MGEESDKYHVRKEYYSTVEIENGEDLGLEELIDKIEEENDIEGDWSVNYDITSA